MAAIALEVETLVQNFLTEVADIQDKSFSAKIQNIDDKSTVTLKAKVQGKNHSFIRMTIKVYDAYELEYFRKLITDFSFMSKHHHPYSLDSDTSTKGYSS